MDVTFVKFDKHNIVTDGVYWIITEKKYGFGYLSARVFLSGETMSVDVSNQNVLYISENICTLPENKQ